MWSCIMTESYLVSLPSNQSRDKVPSGQIKAMIKTYYIANVQLSTISPQLLLVGNHEAQILLSTQVLAEKGLGGLA